MKKLLSIILCAIFLLPLSACGEAGYMTDNAEINKYLALDFNKSPEDVKKIFGEPESESKKGNFYFLSYDISLPSGQWFIFSIMFDENKKMIHRGVNFYDFVDWGYPPKQFVSLEQYKKVSKGMTYKEIVSIFGMEGVKEWQHGDSTTVYRWPLKDSQYSDIEITFIDGVASRLTA